MERLYVYKCSYKQCHFNHNYGMIYTRQFSGMIKKLQKFTICFIMSVYPSVCIKKLGSQYMNYHEIYECFKILSRKF